MTARTILRATASLGHNGRRFAGRVQIVFEQDEHAPGLFVVEVERCPHMHKTSDTARACAADAVARVLAHGDWLDPPTPRRTRSVRRSVTP